MMQRSCYQSPNLNDWQGRKDSLPAERIFQIVQCVNMHDADSLAQNPHAHTYALIGFSSDEGVMRNLGRAGAAQGPYEFRKYFGNLALSVDENLKIFDLGTIACINNNLEQAQKELAYLVQCAVEKNYIPFVIGGGHEVSYGSYLGVSHALRTDVAVINFDAHLDLRPLSPLGSTSGNSFTQIAEHCRGEELDFRYMVIGFEPAANTKSLIQKARELGTECIDAWDMYSSDTSHVIARIDAFIERAHHIYLTICMDVFSHAYAPGVSAPQPLGLTPYQVIHLMKHIIASGKVVCVDIAEYAPALDDSGKTGKLCAYIAHHAIIQKNFPL